MTEAKDWAGELISGQTTTGRILVGIIYLITLLATAYTLCSYCHQNKVASGLMIVVRWDGPKRKTYDPSNT